MGLLLATVIDVSTPQLLALKTQAIEGRAEVTLEATTEWGSVSVRRSQDEVIATVRAEVHDAFATPPPVAPIEAVEIERGDGELRVHVKVPEKTPYELQREGHRLTLLFGAEALAPGDAGPKPTASPLELYRSLFPPSFSEAGAGNGPEETQPSQASAPAIDQVGLAFGPLHLQPSLYLTFVDTTASIVGPAPVDDDYVQVEPRLGLQLVLLNGRVRASYDPRIHMRSQYARINRPSHEFDIATELPLGPRLTLQAADHFALTTLETQEADPGREFFYGFGQFTRNDLSGSAKLEIGPSINAYFGARKNTVRFHETTPSFSDYDENFLNGGLELLVGEGMRLRLGYEYQHVPGTVDRPILESTAHTLGGSLIGDINPLTQVMIRAGYERQEAPLVPDANYNGLALSAKITRDMARLGRLSLIGGRETHVSFFEENPFYVSTSAQAVLDFQLPGRLVVTAGPSYRRNEYRAPVIVLGEPRRDDILGWNVGLGRNMNRWLYLRGEYNYEHRRSNVDVFDSSSRTILVQVGISPFPRVQ